MKRARPYRWTYPNTEVSGMIWELHRVLKEFGPVSRILMDQQQVRMYKRLMLPEWYKGGLKLLGIRIQEVAG